MYVEYDFLNKEEIKIAEEEFPSLIESVDLRINPSKEFYFSPITDKVKDFNFLETIYNKITSHEFNNKISKTDLGYYLLEANYKITFAYMPMKNGAKTHRDVQNYGADRKWNGIFLALNWYYNPGNELVGGELIEGDRTIYPYHNSITCFPPWREHQILPSNKERHLIHIDFRMDKDDIQW